MKNLTFIFLMLIASFGFSQTSLPLDFESGPYTFVDFDGGVTTVITNPQSGGINTSANVAQQVRNGGQAWGGSWILLDDYLNFTTNNTFTMKVFSPAADLPVMLKLEGDDPGTFVELTVNTTVANDWEVLTYNFSGQPSATYIKLVFIFNIGTTGTGEAYLFDDVEFIVGASDPEPTVGAPTPPARDPGDVISIFSDAYTNLTGTDFNPFWGQSTIVTTEVIDGNPTLKYANFNYQGTALEGSHDMSEMEYLHVDMWTYDATDVKVTPISGTGEFLVGLTPIVSESWESYDIPLTEFSGNGVSMDDIFQMKFDGQGGVNPSTIFLDNIYFYQGGTATTYTVTFNVTDGTNPIEGANIAINSQNLTTNASGVATIDLADGSYPYTVTASGYDNETGTVDVSGAAETVDVIMTETASQAVSLPINFESGPYFFNDFNGGVTTVIPNPQSSGINTSANVAQQYRDGGEPWGGSWILLDDYLDFTTNNTFTMKVYSPAADVPVMLKLEGDDPGTFAELIVNTTVADEWEVLTYDYTGQASGTYIKLVFIFDMGTVGTGETYLFDDVEFIDGSGGLNQIDLPVTFEEPDVDYTLTDFGGNVSSLVADPEDATNTVAKVIRGNEGWSGTTIGTPAGFATDIPISLEDSKMNALVWAPSAGIPVMLKIESLVTSTCETVTNTTVSGWQVLEFDFLNERPGTETLEAGINYGWTYNKASIFFDFQVEAGLVTTVGETFYFDDVFFGAASVSINELSKSTLNIYPNPANDIIYFTDKIKFVSIYSINGQYLEMKELTENSINISNLTAGIYIIKAVDNNDNILMNKLIKL